MTTTNRMTPAAQETIELPAAKSVARDLEGVRDFLGEKLLSEQDGCDVRLCSDAYGNWVVTHGDVGYDSVRFPFCGAGELRPSMDAGDLTSLALDLLDQVAEAMACDGDISATYPAMEVEIEESDEVRSEDGESMWLSEAEERAANDPSFRYEHSCTLWADRGEAMYDQYVLGSSWEAPKDMDRAYTVVSGDANTVREQLRKAGYRTVG